MIKIIKLIFSIIIFIQNQNEYYIFFTVINSKEFKKQKKEIYQYNKDGQCSRSDWTLVVNNGLDCLKT